MVQKAYRRKFTILSLIKKEKKSKRIFKVSSSSFLMILYNLVPNITISKKSYHLFLIRLIIILIDIEIFQSVTGFVLSDNAEPFTQVVFLQVAFSQVLQVTLGKRHVTGNSESFRRVINSNFV